MMTNIPKKLKAKKGDSPEMVNLINQVNKLSDYIRDNFVSKEKIKRGIAKLQKSCYEADGMIDGITALHHLREKL